MRILNVDETITDPNNQNSNNQPILQNNQSSSILDKIKLART
jgi:hypothetical protein